MVKSWKVEIPSFGLQGPNTELAGKSHFAGRLVQNGKFLHIHCCSLPRVFWDIQCVDVIRRSLILLGDIRTFAMKGRVRV